MSYDSNNGNGFDHGYGLSNGDGRGCWYAGYFEIGKRKDFCGDGNGYGDGKGFGFGDGDGVG